ncbi:dual specificity protein phosphatase 23 [Trichonephila clavipes]|uniref:Dual specificity protein phosphatase 23 n=1 Tax=Trichonephila inaurata madagascariensis TaxID=2747483 RepID=A0A8X6MKW4_9ARAC|nr:dual specificity protein phosphatase 23 [Trichonephila inaurata madagascariensis]GFW09552.1 dual specificity protein phosphatase 23 [Trichonephila clavipes]
MGSKRPMNFSWVVEGKLAAFGHPSTPANLRFLLENNISYLITLSPECTPPVFTFPDIHWHEIKVREFHPPRNDQIQKFISICEKALNEEKAVGVHCRMGRGRTGVMAACYLVKFKDMTPQSAMGEVRKMRPGSVETYSQEEAVMDYYWSICKERQQNL